MVNLSQDEERYSRMHSFVIWLPLLVGRSAIFLFSFVIFALAGSGRCGAVSSRSGTLDGTFFDSADDTQLISLSFFRTFILTFALHEQQFGQLLLEKTNSSRFPGTAQACRKTGFALRAFHHGKLHICVACLRILPDRTPWRGGVS